jgi:hypothetical protein
MTDNRNQKHNRAGSKATSQHEADAQVIREKTARLRELRLAHEAANKTAGAVTAGRHTATKKKPRNADRKAVPLSEWLTDQQKEGRRN